MKPEGQGDAVEFSSKEVEMIKEALQLALIFAQEHPADDSPSRKIRESLELVSRKENSPEPGNNNNSM
jgi:hypothetical protein